MGTTGALPLGAGIGPVWPSDRHPTNGTDTGVCLRLAVAPCFCCAISDPVPITRAAITTPKWSIPNSMNTNNTKLFSAKVRRCVQLAGYVNAAAVRASHQKRASMTVRRRASTRRPVLEDSLSSRLPTPQMCLKKPPRVRCFAPRNIFRRARHHHFPSSVPALRPQVDHVIHRLDHVQVVL